MTNETDREQSAREKSCSLKKAKLLKSTCLILVLIMVFILGWRVMPIAWPTIKEAVLYPILPSLRPTPGPTIEPYTPHSNTSFDMNISVTDSVIYYFYKDNCRWCRQLEPLIAGLPEYITLHDGGVSNVRLICINKNEDDGYQLISDYYDAYNVPIDRRYVPAIVIGEMYLFTTNEIIDGLMNSLIRGDGLCTPLLHGDCRVQ